LIRKGRAEYLRQFPSINVQGMQAALPDPSDPKAFERCKLDWSECERHQEMLALHRDLLQLRREDPTFRQQRPRGLDGAVLGEQAFVLRFFGDGGDDRLLFINLGPDRILEPAPEPLLAPPENRTWHLLWSSEHPQYGGGGQPPYDPKASWRILGEAAVVFSARGGGGHG